MLYILIGNGVNISKILEDNIMISKPQTKVRIHADHVGSLLRPQKLKETRAQLWERGVLARFGQETQPAELSTIEDAEIEEAVRFQEEIGLPVVTD